MKRRNFLLGAGATVAGSGAVIGSGAFSNSSAFGTVDVTVEEEAAKVYDDHATAQSAQDGNTPGTTEEITFSIGEVNEKRVNVLEDVAGLWDVNDSEGHDVRVRFVDSDGQPYTDIDQMHTDDVLSEVVRDFRLFAVGGNSGDNSGRDAPDGTDNTTTIDGFDRGNYTDQNGTNRTHVPTPISEDIRTYDDPGLSLENNETARISAVLTVGDPSDYGESAPFTFPDIRVDVGELGEFSS